MTSILAPALRSLRDLSDFAPPLRRPSLSTRKVLADGKGPIVVNGEAWPYSLYVQCDFSPEAPRLYDQLHAMREVAA